MEIDQEQDQGESIPADAVDNPKKQIKPDQFSISRGIQTVISAAILAATLFTLWNPRKVFITPTIYDLFQSEAAIETTITNLENSDNNIRIGILAGQWGNSTGNVCADGTIEADVNYEIANRVKISLEEKEYRVDLFPEFDLDLLNYEADALVAVYSGSCLQNPLPPSGFKIGTSLTEAHPDTINVFAVCLAENYQESTRLPFTYEVINPDHTAYHIFRDIHPDTPAVLIEIGKLSTDRTLIEKKTNSIVEGISAGIDCFIESSTVDVK